MVWPSYEDSITDVLTTSVNINTNILLNLDYINESISISRVPDDIGSLATYPWYDDDRVGLYYLHDPSIIDIYGYSLTNSSPFTSPWRKPQDYVSGGSWVWYHKFKYSFRWKIAKGSNLISVRVKTSTISSPPPAMRIVGSAGMGVGEVYVAASGIVGRWQKLSANVNSLVDGFLVVTLERDDPSFDEITIWDAVQVEQF